MKTLISYWGAVLWNTASRYYGSNNYFKQYYSMPKLEKTFLLIKQLEFNMTLIQTRSKKSMDFTFINVNKYVYNNHICTSSYISIYYYNYFTLLIYIIFLVFSSIHDPTIYTGYKLNYKYKLQL